MAVPTPLVPDILFQNLDVYLGKAYVIEGVFAGLFQQRRLRVFYEKRDDIHQAFLSIGCIMIC